MIRWASNIIIGLLLFAAPVLARDMGALEHRFLEGPGLGEMQRVSRGIAGQPSGASTPLFVLKGPGVIRYLSLQCGATPPELLRGAVLEFRWDEDAVPPAIRVPLGDFFGLTGGRFRTYATAAFEVRYAEGQVLMECHLPMPFGDLARVDIINESPIALPEFQLTVDYAAVETDSRQRLMAQWALSRSVLRGGKHRAAHFEGNGLFVGGFIEIFPRQPGECWEAAAGLTVDGSPSQSLDYRSAAGWAGQPWGIAAELSTDRLGAAMTPGGGTLFYRFDLDLPMRFSQSLAFDLYPSSQLTGPRQDDAVSMCYGYVTAAATGTRVIETIVSGARPGDGMVPWLRRLPRGTPLTLVDGIEEAENLRVAAQSPGDALNIVMSGGNDVFFSGARALHADFDSAGDFVEVEYTVRKSDNYRISALVQKGPTMGDFRVLSDGTIINSGFSLHDKASETPEFVRISDAYLTEGAHRLRFAVIGKSPLSTRYGLLLDGIKVEPVEREYVRKWLLIGPFRIQPPAEGSGDLGPEFAKVWPPEEKIDVKGSYDGGQGLEGREWHWYAPGASGHVDLYNGLMTINHSVAYGLTHVNSPDDRDAIMYFGSDDGAVIWVNGKRVLDKPIQRALTEDEDEIRIELRKGWNTILVKVGNSTGEWKFAMRLPAPEGTYEFSPYPP